MPQFTPNYKLAMFQGGEVYSATYDRMRFSIIDNNLWFIATQIGDGTISGWQVTDNGNGQISISYGTGMINNVVAVSYVSDIAELVNNQFNYVWIQRREGLIGSIGAASPIGMLTYVDFAAPASPAEAPTANNILFNSITLAWRSNPEPDIGNYTLYRSADGGSTWTQIVSQPETTYVDVPLLPDAAYQYYFTASDVNGNISGNSPILSTSTGGDPTVPPDPINTEIVAGNEQIQVLWDAPLGNVAGYIVREQPVNSEGQDEGGYFEYDLSLSTFDYTINGLVNDQPYRITVFSVSPAGVRSNGIVLSDSPAYDAGPQGVLNLRVVPFSLDSSGSVAINVTWDAPDSSYAAPPAYYVITITANETDSQPSIYTSNSVTIHQYTINGKAINLQQNTRYALTVQTADDDGNLGNKSSIRFRIPQYVPPVSPTSLQINAVYSVVSAQVKISWTNSATPFAYNLLTIHKVNLNPDDLSYTDVFLLNGFNIGTSTTYQIPSLEISNLARYDVTVVAVDSDGNQSLPLFGVQPLVNTFGVPNTGSGQVITSGGDRPGVPDSQVAIAGNSQIEIRWSQYLSDFITHYNVYKAPYAQTVVPSDFVKVATVDAETLRWMDYDVVNGTIYLYFVTVTDSRGLESLNPSDGYISYVFITASGSSFTSLSQAPVITAIADGYDAILNWVPVADNYDGMVIYRAVGTPYSFTRVGDVGPFITTFTDVNALTLNGNYYYLIREAQNETDVIVTTNNFAPINSIPIALVEMLAGNIVSIDQSMQVNIQNLHDPIISLTKQELALPHDPFVSATNDQRIRLEDEMLVTDWTTSDFVTYSTSVDIADTTTYHVILNGANSNVATYVDTANGLLVFASAVSDGTGKPPIVNVIFDNVGETSDGINASFIEDLYGDAFTQGKFLKERMPQIDHLGRSMEVCSPAVTNMPFFDGYIYTVPTAIHSFTTYDILVSSNTLIAATSQGIYVSNIGDWTISLASPNGFAPHKLFYSSVYQWYRAVFKNVIYYSSDLKIWTPIAGLTNVNIIRDICEDSTNIYVSTDAGIFTLNPSQYIQLLWQQTSPLATLHPGAYALLYDPDTLTLTASGFDGLYESTDNGDTWHKTTDFNITVPLYSLINIDGSYFGVSQTNIWRKVLDGSDYNVIFSTTSYCRKIALFNGSLYITTDEGLLCSTVSIYDTYVNFGKAFPALTRNGIYPPATALQIIGGRIYVGFDNYLYSLDGAGGILTHGYFSAPCPTIYVNTVARSVGVYYSPGQVFFDELLLPTDDVGIVLNYNVGYSANGGWIDINYQIQVFVYLNNQLLASGVPDTTAVSIAPIVNSIVLTQFTAQNSNFMPATNLLAQIVQMAAQITALSSTATVTSSQLASLFTLIRQFNITIDPSLRSNIATGAIGGNLFQVPDSLINAPLLTISPLALTNVIGTFDAVTSKITITMFCN